MNATSTKLARPGEVGEDQRPAQRNRPGLSFLAAVLGFSIAVQAQGPQFEWVRSGGSTASDVVRAVAVDAAGACYVTGEIRGDAEFDGQPVARFGGQDIFVAKYSSAGVLQWVRSAGGTQDDIGRGIGVDAAGNCYVVGDFGFPGGGTARFGSIIVTHSGIGSAAFVAKFNPEGVVEWVRSRNIPNELGLGIAVGSDGTHWITGGTRNNTGAYTEQRNSQGAVIWSRSCASASGTGISVDGNGNGYVTGSARAGAEFGGVILSGPGDVFIAKYDRSGAVQWARLVGGQGVSSTATGTAADRFGNCHVVGYFGPNAGGVIRFDSISITNAGSNDIFLAKYNRHGEVQWVRRAGSSLTSNGDYGNAVAVDAHGNVCITGECSDGTTFGDIRLSGVNQFFYAAAFDPAGRPLWAVQPERASRMSSGGCGVAFDSAGNCFLAGYFAARMTFGAFALTNIGGVEGYTDVLVSKLHRATSPPLILAAPQSRAAQAGAVATLTVSASGVGPLFYQWFLDKRPIDHATNAVLDLTPIQAAQAGAYTVQVRNRFGEVTSEPAYVDVIGPIPVLVSTLAGSGVAGFADSAEPWLARFNEPNGPAVSADGTVFLADVGNGRIRFINLAGTVGTFAGAGEGFLDGPGDTARFNRPLGLAFDAAGDLLIADTANQRIRRAVPFGFRTVTTLAGKGQAGWVNGEAAAAAFSHPNDLVQDEAGNTYVIEFENHTVRKIDRFGWVTTWAGDGTPGYQDGPGSVARFNQPSGLTRDGAGNLFVTEWGNHRIRKIRPDGTVTTIAGTGAPGFLDGPGEEAQFNQPDGIAIDRTGNLYLTEFGNHALRRIGRSGYVQTIAGQGAPGYADGDRAAALFNGPSGLAFHPDGSLIVTETLNHRVRRVELNPGSPGTGPPQPVLSLSLNPVLTIYGLPGESYRIEYAEEARPGEWIALTTVTLSGNRTTWTDPRPATAVRRIYRAVQP